MEIIKKYKKIVAAVAILLIATIALVINYSFKTGEDYVYADAQECICEVDSEDEVEEFYVDIKGAIKNPGVYLANKNNIVKDIIDLAGGIKSTGTTDNINLSKRVTNEMVIYICTKTELKNNTTTTTTSQTITSAANFTTTCTTQGSSNFEAGKNNNTTTLVNINTASKEELMTIPYIGESKAEAIIAYRLENQFSKIEDIMNISGIGESVFAKIKDYITV